MQNGKQHTSQPHLSNDNIDHVTINVFDQQPKPHSYNGLVGGEYYCPLCAMPVQLVAVKQPPKYCPFCGNDQLITDSARFRIEYSKTLNISVEEYDFLMICFHEQKAFANFREYVECIRFGRKPLTNNQYEQTRYGSKM